MSTRKPRNLKEVQRISRDADEKLRRLYRSVEHQLRRKSLCKAMLGELQTLELELET